MRVNIIAASAALLALALVTPADARPTDWGDGLSSEPAAKYTRTSRTRTASIDSSWDDSAPAAKRSKRATRSTSQRRSRSARTTSAERRTTRTTQRRIARTTTTRTRVATSSSYSTNLGMMTGPYNAGPRPRAWCGWWMRTQRGGGPELNVAWNWSRWGSPSGPQVGAVVVWRGHVGEIVGQASNGQWIVRSGNDGGRVRERARSVAGAVFRVG